MTTFLTRAELSAATGIPEGTINRLRRSGQIPSVQLGQRTIRFVLADVEDAMRGGRTRAEPKPKRPKTELATVETLDLPPHMQTPEAKEAVLMWLDYKKKTGKPYKSMSFVALLFKKYPTAQEFIAAVHHSIANNYQGLFAPFNNAKTAKARTNAQANLDLIEKLRREEQPLEVYENDSN